MEHISRFLFFVTCYISTCIHCIWYISDNFSGYNFKLQCTSRKGYLPVVWKITVPLLVRVLQNRIHKKEISKRVAQYFLLLCDMFIWTCLTKCSTFIVTVAILHSFNDLIPFLVFKAGALADCTVCLLCPAQHILNAASEIHSAVGPYAETFDFSWISLHYHVLWHSPLLHIKAHSCCSKFHVLNVSLILASVCFVSVTLHIRFMW